MSKILLKKWFIIILVLKLFCSFSAWFLPYVGISTLGFISISWFLGLILPIIFLTFYIIIGLSRVKDAAEASDEQFADSCYYLGFIFTISSIIFTLFDLNNLDNKLTEIVIRFGAAMLCTVIGLAVRIYLIGFKSNDFNQNMQNSLVIATNNYCLQVDKSAKKLEEMITNIQSSTDNISDILNKTVNDFSIASKKTIDYQLSCIEENQDIYYKNFNHYITNTEKLFSNNYNVLKKYVALADEQIQGVNDNFNKMANFIDSASTNMQDAYTKNIDNQIANTERLFSSNDEVLKKFTSFSDIQITGIYERFTALNNVFNNILGNMRQLDAQLNQYDNHINVLSPKISELFYNIQYQFESTLSALSKQFYTDSQKYINKFEQIPDLIESSIKHQNMESITQRLSQINLALTEIAKNTENKSWFKK